MPAGSGKRRFLKIAIILAGLAAVLVVVVDNWLPYMLLSHHNFDVHPQPEIFNDYQIQPETFLTKTSDGIEIAGWYIKARSDTACPTMIVLHTLGRTREDMLAFTLPFYELGFNMAYFDMRSHGESGGEFFTYGYHEWRDVSAVIDYLEEQKDAISKQIILLGASAGGTVAIAAAAQDERVDGLVTVAAFADLEEMIAYQARMLPKFWRDRTIRKAEQIAKFRTSDASAKKMIRKVQCPVFLSHGTADWYVPFSAAEDLYKNIDTEKQFYRIEGAGHATMFTLGGDSLRQAIVAFVARIRS